MHIIKMKIVNFKKFGDGENIFEFNDDINILVGDNEVGKSTILEAIELGCNCSYRGKSLISELSTDLFNVLAVKQYLESDKKSEYLPEILIELFLDDLPEYRGENNTLGEDGDGISLKIKFDNELLQTYDEFAKNPDGIKTIPTEFYKIEWFDFGWNGYVQKSV